MVGETAKALTMQESAREIALQVAQDAIRLAEDKFSLHGNTEPGSPRSEFEYAIKTELLRIGEELEKERKGLRE